ncbi:MAG: glycine cleavage system protein H [Thermoanaerobacteraceae bacterium]|nr:glycine cleavage system protein H [Thermoanaerobacteraceae bacterium]
MGEWFFPRGLLYNKEHLWLKIEDFIATVGLTDYAQDTRGDVLYLGLPKINQQVQKGDTVATIETGKWVGRIFAPVTGTIVDVNRQLISRPQLINQDPYGEGWIFRVRITNQKETTWLLQCKEFCSWLEAELGKTEVCCEKG